MKLTDIKQIHVVPYAHHDHAWTNTRAWHIRRYVEGFCRTLDLMNENPDYTTQIDDILHSLEAFERYCPSRVEEFVGRVREGRIGVANGGKALIRPADFDGEMFIRNAVAGRNAFADRFGVDDIPVYWNADTACGTSQMPQLLKLLGHSFYRFQRPENTLNRMNVPLQFIWRGLDDSEIAVVRGLYGGCTLNRWADPENDTWEKRRDAFIEEELSDKLSNAASDQMLLHIGQDDCLPMLDLHDRFYPFDALMEEWNRKESSHMTYSTLERLCESIDQADLPIWQGPIDECELSFNAAVRVDASLRVMRLKCERGLVLCEKLNAIACGMGAESREKEIHALWERAFRFVGHAMQHLLDTDYDIVRDSAAATVAMVAKLREKLLDEIARRTDSGDVNTMVVVNLTLRGGLFTVDMNLTTAHHIDGLKLTDENGQELEYQIYDTLRGDKPYDCQYTEVRAAVRVFIPAMGVNTVHITCDGRTLPEPEPIPLPKHFSLRNGSMEIRFTNGLIDSIATDDGTVQMDGTLLKPCFDATESTGDWTYNWKPTASFEFKPEQAMLTENGPLRWKIVTKGLIHKSPAALTAEIERNSKVIRYHLTLDNREGEGYYTLRMPCEEDAEIFAGIPFGEEARHPETNLYAVEDDVTDSCNWERGWEGALYANGYASFRNGNGRLLFLQGDCSNMMCKPPHERLLKHLLYRSVDLSLKTVKWMQHMNEDMEGRGLQHFSFAIAVESKHDSAQAQALLQAQRQPICQTARFTIERGTSSAPFSLLSTGCDHVALSTAYIKEGNLFVRVWETGGIADTLKLTLPKDRRTAAVVDLNGIVTADDLSIEAHTLSVPVRPYEILTLKLN